jgi:subtilase family protein
MLSPLIRRRGVLIAGAVAVAAVAAVAGVAVGAAPPARADSVRDAQLWVLNDMNVQPAWALTHGAGVTVAVIDSGVDGQVSDLTGSVIQGPDYTGVHTPPSDPHWGMHGTWMASLVAGHGHDDGTDGILGTAPAARVLSIRVITDRQDPGFARYERQPLSRGQQELAAAITYAVRHHAGIISMSLGYSGPSRAVRLALQDAYRHNVVVVASSGNSGTAADEAGRGSAPYSFPADYPGVLGVAAINATWQPASFSSDNLSVQVAAPGVSVPAQGRDGNYWLVSGTSPACALTAGVAALIKSRFPGLSDAQVIDAITRSTWHRPPHGYDKQVGFGTVDAAAALTAARRVARLTRGAAPGAGLRSGGSAAQRHGGAPGRTVATSGYFGGGPRAVPPPPVPPRGPLALVLFGLLGLVALALVAAAALRLVTDRSGGDGRGGRGHRHPPPGWSLPPTDGAEQDAADRDPDPAAGVWMPPPATAEPGYRFGAPAAWHDENVINSDHVRGSRGRWDTEGAWGAGEPVTGAGGSDDRGASDGRDAWNSDNTWSGADAWDAVSHGGSTDAGGGDRDDRASPGAWPRDWPEGRP